MESKIIKKLVIEIDDAMLGSDWHGNSNNLEDFAELYLNELVNEYTEIDEISVIPRTDSWNGANQSEIYEIEQFNGNPELLDSKILDSRFFSDESVAWENACKKSPQWWWLSDDEKIEKMKSFLTSLEIMVVKKRWDEETLTNSERQTLNRIRIKRENTLKMKPQIEFFEQFDI